MKDEAYSLNSARLALLMHDSLTTGMGKMGLGLLRYSEAEITAVIDRSHAGEDLVALTGIHRAVPIVSEVADAVALGADTLVPGVAPAGGALPPEWRAEIAAGLSAGLSLVNGLHTPLAEDPELRPLLQPGRFIWDVRREPAGLENGMGRAAALPALRVLTVGTDMAIGKMTASIEMDRAARRAGLRSRFLASGQIGICIAGEGVPLDAVRVDFASGAVEALVMRYGYDHDILFIEGQGSVLHPASTAWLPLIRGSCPTHLILVHRWEQRTLARLPEVEIPPLQVVAGLYEAVCAAGGAFPAAKVAGIALNCAGLDDDAARAAVAATAAATGLPVVDVVRFGAEPLIEAILQRHPDRAAKEPTGGMPPQDPAQSQNQTEEAAHLRLGALIQQMKAQGTLREPRVEVALRALPRHLFLPGFPLERVYEDDAIQTKQDGEARSSCSQPTVIAEMLEMLRPQAGETVLEIGAGTGWNAALIGNLVGPEGRVVTLDIDEDTAERARENLTRAGVTNVEARCADGGYGAPAHGPYDAIVATASAAAISPHWLEQLKPGGRMVVPLTYNTIEMVVAFRKETTADGAACLVGRDFRHFYFMPLRGEFARARTWTHTPEIQLACEPAFSVEAEAVLHLLRLPSREIILPDLKGEATGGLIDYLALRGEPMVLVTRSIEGGSEALQGLAEPDSLALMEVWWQDSTRGQAPLRFRSYGSGDAADRLSALANEWVERNRPGLDQMVFTVAPIGTLPESPEAPPVRRHGMEYRADILTKRPEDQ